MKKNDPPRRKRFKVSQCSNGFLQKLIYAINNNYNLSVYLILCTMLNVNPLLPEVIPTLEDMHKNQSCHAHRIKAHAILLSVASYKLSMIPNIYDVGRQTAATWLHAWQDASISALFDKPRIGRPCMLSEEIVTEALVLVNQSPRSLKKVRVELSESLGLTLSISTLKKLCNQAVLITLSQYFGGQPH